MKSKETGLNVLKAVVYLAASIVTVSLLLSGCGSAADSAGANTVAETAASSMKYDVSENGFSGNGIGAMSSGSGTSEYSASYSDGVLDQAADMSAGNAGVTKDSAAAVSEEELSAEAGSGSISRKLIKTVDVSVETTDFDALTEDVNKRVTELGGYVESSGVYGEGYYRDTRYANYTVRIPADRLDEFLSTALTAGKVTSRTESVEDITLRYTDMESRVSTLEAEQARLLELIASAQDVDAIIALETRLSEIRYQLESIKSSLKVYDNQVTYSTVYIYVQEVKVVSSTAEASFAERISAGFEKNLIELGAFLEAAAIAFIINIPAIIVFIIFAAIVIFIIKTVLIKCGLIKKKEKTGSLANKDDRKAKAKTEAEAADKAGAFGKETDTSVDETKKTTDNEADSKRG